MENLDAFPLWLWIAFYAIALTAGLVQGTFGFGYPAISTPVLVLLTDVKTSIVVNLLPNLAVNLVSTLRGGNWAASLKPHWPLAVYVVTGSFVGASLLLYLPDGLLRLMLASMIFVFLYQDRLGRTEATWVRRHPKVSGVVFGLGGGFCSGTVNLSLPVLIIYFMLLGGLSATALAQILNLCFFSGRIVQATTLGLAGALPLSILWMTVPTAVIAVAALYAGGEIQKRFDAQAYRKILRRILFAMGLVLIAQALWWISQRI